MDVFAYVCVYVRVCVVSMYYNIVMHPAGIFLLKFQADAM